VATAPFIKLGGVSLDDNLHAEVIVTQQLNSHWSCTISLRQTGDRRFPSEDMLGKEVQISTHDDQGAENRIFTGVVTESELEYEIYGSYTARLSAISQSYLLDFSPKRQYFPAMTGKAVVEKLVSAAGLGLEGDMPAGKAEKYHQLEESDWRFLLRLVDDAEAWVRPTENGVEARTSFQQAVDLNWRQEGGGLHFRVAGRLSQPSANGAHYDPETMESRVYNEVSDSPVFYGSASKMVAAVKQQSKSLFPPDYIYQRSRAGTLEEFKQRLKRESRRSLGRSVVCTGESRNPYVRAGNEVNIQGPLDAQGTYGVTRVVHSWTNEGYTNHFECTPWQKYTNPEAPKVQEYPGLIPARVVDNNDPDNSGRVQVQFYWQEDNVTKWITMMAPHAGADRGFMFLPEIGDEVWVAFEEGDPERPRVLGCSWNGVQKPPRDEFWGGDVAPNDVKRIVTKSGHRISIVDKNGKSSIVLATPQHVRVSLIENSNETGDSMLALHSDGDIFLSAPNGRIHFNSKYFSREVGPQGSTNLASGSEGFPAAPPFTETHFGQTFAAVPTPGGIAHQSFEEPSTQTKLGRVSHTSPAGADTLIRKHLAEPAKNAIKAGRKIAGSAEIVGEPEWSKAGEDHYGAEVWKTKKDTLNGFVDSHGRVWIHRDRGNRATMIHEAIHKYSDPAILNQSQPLNEGITEYYTRRVAEPEGMAKGRVNYEGNYETSKKLVDIAGADNVDKAYFDGDVTNLRQVVDGKLGNGKWDDFLSATKSRDWDKASKLLAKPK